VDLGFPRTNCFHRRAGFSFQSDAMLDMRMDKSQRLTAADLINSLAEDQLSRIITLRRER